MTTVTRAEVLAWLRTLPPDCRFGDSPVPYDDAEQFRAEDACPMALYARHLWPDAGLLIAAGVSEIFAGRRRGGFAWTETRPLDRPCQLLVAEVERRMLSGEPGLTAAEAAALLEAVPGDKEGAR